MNTGNDQLEFSRDQIKRSIFKFLEDACLSMSYLKRNDCEEKYLKSLKVEIEGFQAEVKFLQNESEPDAP